jgi:tetratricopeptide (TPR) repeat protein
MSQEPSSPDRNPFEVLGLQGTEELPAIRKAFLAIAARSHPDRLRMKSPEEKAQALELFLGAKKAFEVLSQPDKRREWAERLARARSVPPPIPRTPSGPVVPPPIPRTPPGPVAIPRTPFGPVTPPPEAANAPPRPTFTPVHGVPVTSPPRPGTAPAPASRGPPMTPPPRTGPLPAAAALQLYKLGLLALEAADYAKALDLFAKASRLSPSPRHQSMELVARGHQYLTTRFFDRARESFERALQLLPECREARVGLELLDKQSGRYLKGR